MTDYDEGFAALKRLAASEPDRAQAGRNEATTRLQVIDRLLFETLGWDRHDCTAEDSQDGRFADYALLAPRRVLVVEAKKEGVYFELPAGAVTQSPRIGIRYFEKQAPAVFGAIRQAIDYCQARGTPVGAVCNGHQIVAFLASRLDGVPPLDGDALVFDSLENM